MKRNLIGALVLMGAVLQAAPAWATVWYVNGDIQTPGTGMTPATAFKEIQDIQPPTLQAGHEIWIAGGTALPYQATVTAYSGVKILGGFSPSGDSAFTIRNPGLYPTVIDASSSNVGLEVVSDALPSTLIEGLTIQNAGVFGIVNGSFSRAVFRHLILKDNGGNSSASGAFDNGIDYAFARIESWYI